MRPAQSRIDPFVNGLVSRLPNAKVVATRATYAAAGLAQDPATLNELVCKNLAYTVGYYRRALSLRHAAYRHRLQRTIRVDGLRHLEAASKRGGGVILVAAHIGDFDLAGSWIAEMFGTPPVVPVASVREPARQRFYDDLRRSCGFVVRRQETTRLDDLADDIDRGRIVILMLDRRVDGPSTQVDLLNRTASVSMAPHRLAALTGASLLSAVTWNVSPSSRILSFGAPTRVDASTEPSRDARITLGQIAYDIEQAVRAAPHQWHVPADLTQLPWGGAIEPSAATTTRMGRAGLEPATKGL